MRYIIGIDLGTTNSAVSYVDKESKNLKLQTFRISQLTELGMMDALKTLPSFCYLPLESEFQDQLMLDVLKETNGVFVGQFAKSIGAKTPTRLVQSAKSWLCHQAANRQDRILPVNDLEGVKKLSPVQATSAYLKAISVAWNKKMAKNHPEFEFHQQEIVLTVPASFDEVARVLTVQAAKEAGYLNVTLLEEPQSAFYSFIADNEKKLDEYLKPEDLILVVDVGGGTTDFSLIETKVEENGFKFNRMAVGDHLLLGGDNMDALIYHMIEEKAPRLSTNERLQMKHEARKAKEELLGEDKESYRFVLHGKGSNVVSGSQMIELTKNDVLNALLNGFFSFYEYDSCSTLKKASGIKSFGLPYEDEPSIIKQLGYFLHQAGNLKPNKILFNGGAMKPKIFQNAICEALRKWFPDTEIKELPSNHLDLAVSLGAAYFGKARFGSGLRISGGIPRSYYLQLQNKNHDEKQNLAITILCRGQEEGSSYEPEMTFYITPNKPVSFQLYTSHVRLFDEKGQIVQIEPEQMQLLPPIQTVLKFGNKLQSPSSEEKIPVHLKVLMTEIGTLEIFFLSQISNHRWALEFQLKNHQSQENALDFLNDRKEDMTFDADLLDQAKELIEKAFSEKETLKLESLNDDLENVIGMEKKQFPPSVLRALFDKLLLKFEGRLLSQKHLFSFYHLAGFYLRPGYGYPLDDYRIKNFWKVILTDLKIPRNQEIQIQRLIALRRIAGGLTKGQQMQLMNEVIPDLKQGKIEIKGKSEHYFYSEKIRTFASFESLEQSIKVKIGKAILERFQKKIALDADFFALSRIGGRLLLNGTFSEVIHVNHVKDWIQKLLDIKGLDQEKLLFLISQIGRKTTFDNLNLDEGFVQKILNHFLNSEHFNVLKESLTTVKEFSMQEHEKVFGESLPVGLSL